MEENEANRFEAEYEARLEREADEAMDRLERGQTWLDWRKIAELFTHGRKLSMLRAHTNRPEGKGYTLNFSAWLDQHPKLRKIDKATRNHALQCFDLIHEIDAWRETLAENQRQTINHPTTVLRRFKAANKENAGGDAAPKKQTEREALREANATLEGEVQKLKRTLEQSGENLFSLSDSAKSIARLLRDYWSANKLAELSKALTEEAKVKRTLEGKTKNGGPKA